MEEKKIPEQVKEAAKGLETEIVFKHRKRGYDVYSVGMPCKKGEIPPPTGYPCVILYRKNEVKIIADSSSLDWL